MQEYFGLSYTSRCQFLEEIRQATESRMSPLKTEITDSRLKTRDAFDALYCKIVSYILQRSSVSSPADADSVNQAKAALQSVLPPAELAAFMALLKKDKEQQLDELTRIVAGICLFNKASVNEKCLHETFPVSFEGIENELSASRRLVGKYTTLLEELLEPDSRRVGRDVPVDLLKQALYNARQHEAFLKILLSNAHLCASCMGDLQTKLSAQTNLLKESVKAKRAVHSAKVFPLFKALADLWCGLREEAELLKVLHTIMLNLQPFTVAQAELFPAEYLDGLLEGSEVKTDQDRLSQPSDGQINLAEMTTCEWLPSETDASISDLSLQFNGFCGYTFVCRDGLLLPGNPKLGVLKHEWKFYAFSSREAALEFASRPDVFIAEVEERAKGSPE
uniref:Cilia- and flagella-associated protein 206 n=1 Tax=Tetraodon nigroviridis TaxID=99883 RepID=H3DPD6_TETNG